MNRIVVNIRKNYQNQRSEVESNLIRISDVVQDGIDEHVSQLVVAFLYQFLRSQGMSNKIKAYHEEHLGILLVGVEGLVMLRGIEIYHKVRPALL